MRSTTTTGRPAAIRRIVGLGSVALALLFSLLGWRALQERESLWQLQLAAQGELQKLALQSAQTAQQQQAQMLAQTIAADSWVTELVRQAHSLRNDEASWQYRNAIGNQLKTRLLPRWRGLQEYQPFELSVHLAPGGESLLQIPQAVSNLTATPTPMLNNALRERRNIAGLNLSQRHFTIGAITPLYVPNGNVEITIGAVEVQLGLLANVKQIDRDLDAGIALLGHLPNSEDGTAQTSRWEILAHSRDQVLHWQQRGTLPTLTNSSQLKLLEDNGRTYLLNQIPLPGYASDAQSPTEHRAYALVWRDISEIYALHHSDNNWMLVKWLFAWLGAEALLLLLLLATRNSTRSIMLSHQHALRLKHQQSEYSRQLLTIITQAQSVYIDTQNQQETFAELLQRIIELTDSQAGLIGEVVLGTDDSVGLRTIARQDAKNCGPNSLYCLSNSNPAQPPHALEELFEPAITRGQLLLDLARTAGASAPNSASNSVVSMASLPIHHQGEMIGLLGLINRAEGYSRELVEQLQPLLSTLAQLIVALHRDIQREQANSRMYRQQQTLHALNEIAALPGNDTQQQLRRALQIGAQFYAMPLAIISQIEAQTYTVKAQVSPADELHNGQQFALSDTYCSLTLQQTGVLAIDSIPVSADAIQPCYERFTLESYIGTCIWLNGQRFGTLSFFSDQPRTNGFDDSDREFIRLFARWVGSTLERQQQEQESQHARRYLQTVLDSAIGASIIATDTNGLISLFNSGAERLLGYHANDVVGRLTLMDFHLQSEVNQRASELTALLGERIDGFAALIHLARSGEPQTRQWTYQHKSGEARIVNLTINAITDSAGAISGYLGVGSDISDLHFTTHALQKSQQRFRSMVANLPGVIYRCDHDEPWTMRYIGDEILSISGYPANDLVGNQQRSLTSLVHPDDLRSAREVKRQIAQGKAFELTYRIMHADGHPVWVREKGRGEYDTEGNLLWLNGFIWDISARKAVEDELQVSQQRFSSAFSTAPQGMALVSIDGELMEVNDELCRILDYSRVDLLNVSITQITHPQDKSSDNQYIRDLLAGRATSYQIEKRYLDRQGRTLWVLLSVSLVRDSQGQALHFVSQIQDFTQRVAAERAIREREHYLRTLLDNVVDAIITLDEVGHIETFNHAAEHIFGYSARTIMGEDFRMLMPPIKQPDDLSEIPLSDLSELLGNTREQLGLRENGEIFTMELAVSEIHHQGERRLIAVIRDISERKRIEQMKNEFVSTVSHELRTPLTAIAGSLGLINGGALGSVPKSLQSMLEIAENNSNRLSIMVKDLLDMEKLVAGKMSFSFQAQALQPLIEQSIALNQPYAQQYNIRLHQVQHDAHVWVLVDTQRLLQVLTNLLSNAAKFSPSGATVEISVRQVLQTVRVSVRDFGCGIPAAFQSRIFSKFSQADSTNTRQKGGTGLGLSISKELIEQMHGQIGYESQEGQGSTFRIELPIHEHLH